MRRVAAGHSQCALVLALFIGLGVFYSLATPLFEAPDEQWHFAYVQYVAQGNGLPVQTLDKPMHLARQEGSQPPLYYLIAAGATLWIDTSDYSRLVWENPHYGYNVPGIVNDNKNLFIHTARESWPYQGTVLAIHIGRLLSVLMGALAVYFTYRLSLEVFSGNKALAASAVAVAAFVPQFIFVSAAVSNDSTVVAMTALTLWLIVRLCMRHKRGQAPSVRELGVLGVAAGLTALAKVSGAGIAILAGVALLYVFRKDWKQLVFAWGIFGSSAFAVAGWWYLRNWYLYGDLTGTAMMSRIFGTRTTWLTLPELLVQLGEVWETFWVGFGWGNIRALPIVYQIFAVAVLLGCVGLLVGYRRQRTFIRSMLPAFVPLALLAAWIGIVLAEMLNWMETTQAPHGRLLFPILPALAPLLVLGLTQWFPERVSEALARLPGLALGLFALFALFGILQPAYTYPASLGQNELAQIPSRVDITYGDTIKLLGYDLSPRSVDPGDSLQLVLYWQALGMMDRDWSIGIHLLDARGQVVGGRDSYPGHGLLPTTLWQPGQTIRDVYWLPVVPGSAAGVATIQVDFYSRTDKQTLPALDKSGQAITPLVGRLKIAGNSPAPQPKFAVGNTFGEQIELLGYDLDAAGENKEQNLVLYWKRAAPVPVDYTVFVHLLDKDGGIIAQMDQQPAKGSNPTSLWGEGEVVADSYRFAWDAHVNQIKVGLYRAETGERLSVKDEKRNERGDHVILPLSGVSR